MTVAGEEVIGEAVCEAGRRGEDESTGLSSIHTGGLDRRTSRCQYAFFEIFEAGLKGGI